MASARAVSSTGNLNMHVSLKQPYLSIKDMGGFDLPEFAVLIGKNGVGKTQVLAGISKGHLHVSNLARPDIELYDSNLFHSGDSGPASWEDSQFRRGTFDKYFAPSSGTPLVEVAEEIFEETLERFGLAKEDEARRALEETIRTEIRKILDFEILGAIQGDDVVTSYSNALQQRVFQQLNSSGQTRRPSRGGRPTGVGNSQAALVSLAMKLSDKLPHELNRSDIHLASNYEGGTIGNQLSQLFTKYKVEQYSWAHTQGEASDKSIQTLMREYREAEYPPWVTLRSVLVQMRDASADPELFNFEFSDPEQDTLSYADHRKYSFETRFTNRSTGESYPTQDLSSGEKILLSMCFAAYNKAMGRRQPGLLLLDEVDAVLHPSMISALIAGLKELFVDNGTPVIMATHSVTTVSLLDEEAIFRVSRSGGRVDVRPATRSEAVEELSEGLATIDEGLRIATSESAAAITILSEGNNALHLRKWAELFFPGKVAIFDKLLNLTGKNQLASYANLLARVETNSHFLIVWDCDARTVAEKLRTELEGSNNVTPFAFSNRANNLAPEGIENLYEEEHLEGFITTATREATGEVTQNMSSRDKTDFAKHVMDKGTKDYFKHYVELGKVVQDILKKSPKS